MKSTLLISLSFVAFTAFKAGAQENPADIRAYSNLERLIKESDEIREKHESDYARLGQLQKLYPKGHNAAALIEEHHQLVKRLTYATDELQDLRDEFKENSKGLQMRMVMSGLGAAMAPDGEGLQLNVFSRFMAFKTRMDKNRKFTRTARHRMLEEKADFVRFEAAYKQKQRLMIGGTVAGLLLLIGGGGWWFLRQRRAMRALPPPPPAA